MKKRVYLLIILLLCISCVQDNSTESTVTDTITGHDLVKIIDVSAFDGYWPKQVRLSPNGLYAGVPCMKSDKICFISTETYTVVKTLTTPAHMPVELTYSPDSRYAYIECLNPGSTVVVDMSNFKIVKQSGVHGDWPKIIEFTPDYSELWISDWSADCIRVIDSKTLLLKRNILTPKTPRGIGFLTDRPRAYIANFFELDKKNGTITIIDTDTYKIVKIFNNLGGAPRHVIVSPDNKYVYVSNMWNSVVHVIDTSSDTIITNIITGRRPKTIDLTSNGQYLYSANYVDTYSNGNVTVHDLSDYTQVDIFEAGTATTGLDVSPDDAYVWITNIYDNTVAVYKIIRSAVSI